MRSYVIEFIGTFFLVLIIALTGNPLAIGFTLAALVYIGGYISGGHYNPAVTLAVLLTRSIKPAKAAIYMLVQILGGFAAAFVFQFLKAKEFIPAPGEAVQATQVITVEVLFTFLLCFAVLHTAVAEKTKNNGYFGLAIGLALMVGAFAGGPISGGVYNPAVAIGPLLVADFPAFTNQLNNLIVYIFSPLIGAALAALVYKINK